MSMPKEGTPEYLQLLEETGGASSLPGFNYEAHLAVTANIPAKEVQEEPKPASNTNNGASSDTSNEENANTSGLISNKQETRLPDQEKDLAPIIDNDAERSAENSPEFVVEKTKQSMPSEGTAEYQKLIEETGGASGLPGFNYQAHLAATQVSTTTQPKKQNDPIDSSSTTMPLTGTVEYQQLLEETGDASVLPGFNYQAHLAETRAYPVTKTEKIETPIDDTSLTMPLIGTIEYQQLLEETGGASGLPGFNYDAHILAKSSSNENVDSNKEILLITPPFSRSGPSFGV